MSSKLEELIKQAQDGNKDAFGEIYKLYLDKIYRFIFFSVRNRDLAEDLTQSTFLRAWRSLASFSIKKGTIQAFLYAIARNLITDWYRKKKDLSLEVIGDYASLENIEDEFVQKEERVKAKSLVWQGLSKLKDYEKQIIILRFFEELPFADIANITGKNEGAIRVRFHRTLKTLKEILKQKYEN